MPGPFGGFVGRRGVARQSHGPTRTPGNLLVWNVGNGDPTPRSNTGPGWYTNFNSNVPPSGRTYVVEPGAPGGYAWRSDFVNSASDQGDYWNGLLGASYNRLYAHARWRMTSHLLPAAGGIRKIARYRDSGNNNIIGGVSWIFASMTTPSGLAIGLDLLRSGSETVNGVAHPTSPFLPNANLSFDISAQTFVAQARDVDLMFDYSQRASGIIECAVWVDGVQTHDYTGANAIHGTTTNQPAGGCCEFFGIYNHDGPDAVDGVQSEFVTQLELSSSAMV